MSSISVLVGAPFSRMYSSRTLYTDFYHCLLMIRCRPGHIDSHMVGLSAHPRRSVFQSDVRGRISHVQVTHLAVRAQSSHVKPGPLYSPSRHGFEQSSSRLPALLLNVAHYNE